jgi:hypothetical protein
MKRWNKGRQEECRSIAILRRHEKEGRCEKSENEYQGEMEEEKEKRERGGE